MTNTNNTPPRQKRGGYRGTQGRKKLPPGLKKVYRITLNFNQEEWETFCREGGKAWVITHVHRIIAEEQLYAQKEN